jgi:ElaA protein
VTTVRRARWSELDATTAHHILRLRVDVFVVEQACPYPEIDGRDVEPTTEHLWVSTARLPVAAYLRVLTEPDAVLRVGRVVTAPAARGRGLARLLMDDVLDRHRDTPLVLDAQSPLVPWYAAFGFEPTGPEFLEDGIPHVTMSRYGSAATSSGSATRGPV